MHEYLADLLNGELKILRVMHSLRSQSLKYLDPHVRCSPFDTVLDYATQPQKMYQRRIDPRKRWLFK